MEQFCKELLPRICVDYNNEEVQDIMKAVDILMKRLVEEIGKTNPDIKIKDLVLCGSNAEKTRVWGRNDEIEFDYLAVMKTWPGIENFRFQHCTDGQIEVQFLVNGEDNPFAGRQYISLYEATDVFHQIVNKCLREKCQQNLCPKIVSSLRYLPSALNCCKFCSVSMNTGILKHVWIKKSDSMSPDKLVFLWKSKYKSIKSINVNEIYTQYLDTRKLQDGFPLPEWYQCKDRYYETLHVPVDFHPVIEIDQSAKVHQEFRIFPWEAHLLLPPSYVRATQTVGRNQWRTLKDRDLASFVLKLIFCNRTPMVKVIPELDRRTKFFLFPKSNFQHVSHGCWRISSCPQEKDILCETSEEHRKAYCLLKFLAPVLFRSPNIIGFHNYEIKISVINHIIQCKNPSVGAHVCMLSIMQEISLCRGKRIMEHPILHLNLYDMIGYFIYDTKRLIGFKVLILLLANEKGMYTLEDLFNDIFSVQSIYSWYTEVRRISSQAKYPKLVEITERVLMKELKELIRNRKRNSSKYLKSQLMMYLSWKKRQWQINNTVFPENINYINVL